MNVMLGLRPPLAEGSALRERALIEEVQKHIQFEGTQALIWGQEQGLIEQDSVIMAEISPTLRCPLNCFGCPDASSNLQRRIVRGETPRKENRAPLGLMQARMELLSQLGVTHFMLIGGTIDTLTVRERGVTVDVTALLCRHGLDLGAEVSWFTDGIPQLEENGRPSHLLTRNFADGWIKQVATHLSLDYAFPQDLFAENLHLTPKVKGAKEYKETPETSRRFKSEYGAVTARRLIENGVRRIVLNTTISWLNADQILPIYQQVAELQAYAERISSPTEVLWTFSPWTWRPHQARGDAPQAIPASGGIQYADMPIMNRGLQVILLDTYQRVQQGKPRLLANSSGYTLLHALPNPEYQSIVVQQDVPYHNGRSEMYNIRPDGTVTLDPMFYGPELKYVRSTFGYRDREPRKDMNPFTRFHDKGIPYLPNIVCFNSQFKGFTGNGYFSCSSDRRFASSVLWRESPE